MIKWFLNALLVLLFARLILRFVLGLFQGLTEPRRDGASATGAADGAPGRGAMPVALVRDPVCSTYIPRDQAVTASVGGETRYYCSDACRAKDAEVHRFKPPIGRAAHG